MKKNRTYAEPEIIKYETNTFGFYSDTLSQQIETVKKNQTLSDILQNFKIATTTIHNIADKSKEIFNVRQIRPGKIYHAFTDNDTSNTLKYFVYEKDPVNYIVYDLRDSVNIYEGSKEVIVKQNVKTATIDHSLYVALTESDASPQLAIKLSQIFAWQIDFYHLQKGDNFKVVYEEHYINQKGNLSDYPEDLQFVGIGKILAAYFQHNGKDFYAIPFIQNSTFQYFDENGNSLRKAFLKAPLEFGRISSRFSRSRLHPVLGVHKPHLGVDYAAPVGTPVLSTGDGVIVEASYQRGNGNYLKVRHNSVYTTMYLHLSRFAKGIKRGTNVKQGQVIGYVGSTGLSTGPHLDYRFYVNGTPVDPLKVEVPPSYPVKEELLDEFNRAKNKTMSLLGIYNSESLFANEPYILTKSSSK
jgi:murein DD-endopeptidase MepM/ murein hydrolase activator NlpD